MVLQTWTLTEQQRVCAREGEKRKEKKKNTYASVDLVERKAQITVDEQKRTEIYFTK